MPSTIMTEETPSTRRQRKLRSSCDRCGAAKLRCDRSQPECARCLSVGIACVYGVSRKAGKPARNRDREREKEREEEEEREREREKERDRRRESEQRMADELSCYGSTRGSLAHAMMASNSSASDCSLDHGQSSSAWPKLDSYRNNLIPAVHLLDAFRDHPIDLSLPALNALEFDDHLSAGHDTDPITSTLGSPTVDNDSTSAGQSRASSTRYQLDQFDESLYFNSDLMLPIPTKDHNCCREAHEILGVLSLLNPNLASSTSSSLGTDLASTASGITNSLPLDHILRLIRESSEQLGYLLACSCARYPHLALLYASIISRIMIWYEQAASGCQRASWSPEVAVADPIMDHFSSSSAGYMTGTGALSSWSNSTVNTGGTCTPTRTGSSSATIAVTSTHLTMGSFAIDDTQVQRALRTQLLLGEMRRTSHLIQLFASRSSSDLDGYAFVGVDGLYKSLSSWLNMEHVRITDIIQSKLKEINS